MGSVPIRTLAQLDPSLDDLRAAPPEAGTLTLLVRRPSHGQRELPEEVLVDEADGVVGDNWRSRATSRAKAEGRHLDAQVTVMSSRMVRLLGDSDEERALAGDQLYVDLDLSHDNLPTGSRLQVGDDVVLEVTAKPHAGCKKFLAHFGTEAVAFVNSVEGRRLRLRGLNTRVVQGGVVRVGDDVRRLASSTAPSDVSGRSQAQPRG
jgi:hypothetical protein